MSAILPVDLRSAAELLRSAFASDLGEMAAGDFVRSWCAIAYLFPGLHPDSYEDEDSGWPSVLRPFAAEAWRRASEGTLTDEELYPSDATWTGLYDRGFGRKPQTDARRREIACN
jgi:hypothetical protein